MPVEFDVHPLEHLGEGALISPISKPLINIDQGPYRSGMSRQVPPEQSTQNTPLSNCGRAGEKRSAGEYA